MNTVLDRVCRQSIEVSPLIELTEDEWVELYRYLLSRLLQLGYIDTANDVEQAAAIPIVEEYRDPTLFSNMRPEKTELGKNISRPASPHEVFAAAINVLESRLREIPAAVQAAIGHLEREASDVQFHHDIEERYLVSETTTFSLNAARLGEEERRAIDRALSDLREHVGTPALN